MLLRSLNRRHVWIDFIKNVAYDIHRLSIQEILNINDTVVI
jgi:hypothetical protein